MRLSAGASPEVQLGIALQQWSAFTITYLCDLMMEKDGQNMCLQSRPAKQLQQHCAKLLAQYAHPE